MTLIDIETEEILTATTYSAMTIRMLQWGLVVLGLLAPANAQQVELFAILDRFDSLDTTKHPCVCVVHRDRSSEWCEYGFQLRHDGTTAYVQWLSLQRETIRLDQPERDSYGRMVRRTIAPADLRSLVPILISKQGRNIPFRTASVVGAMKGAGEAIVLARALVREGHDDDAKRLFDAIPDARAMLARGLARRVALDRTDPRYSWQELLDRHNMWLRVFDDPRGSMRAKRDQLQKTIAELAAPSASKVRRALLNDVWLNSNEAFDASMVKPPTPPPTDGTRPLDLIRRMGLEAVPELIELLEDETPSRACSHTERFSGLLRAQPLRAQANEALSQLSGLPWLARTKEQTVFQWINWYAEASELGIRACMGKAVDRLQPTAITTYLNRWPDGLGRVLTAIQAEDMQIDPRRIHAITLLLKRSELHEREDVRAALRDAANKSRWPHRRAELRRMLLRHGDLQILPQVIASFEELSPAKIPTSDTLESRRYCALLAPLLKHSSTETWTAIGSTLKHKPGRYWLATELVEKKGREPLRQFVRSGSGARQRAAHATMLSALGQLLAMSEHLAARLPLTTDANGPMLLAVDYADGAALALATAWPNRYRYEPILESESRRAQLPAVRRAFAKHMASFN